jgi:hypothetical protein
MPKGKREEFLTQNVWFIAAIWMTLALSASLISIWAGISVALVEILVGVVAGNFLGIHATTEWSVVILSAFVPTLIAQKFFQPSIEAMHPWGVFIASACES